MYKEIADGGVYEDIRWRDPEAARRDHAGD